MELITEHVKLDVALAPVSISNTNLTGAYFPMASCRRAVMQLVCGALAASKVATLELWQGKTRLGTSGALLATASAVITANSKVSKATATLSTVLTGQTLTVNGLVYTAHATVTDVTLRQFSIASSDNAAAGQLVVVLSDPIYGVPGVFVSAASAVVTLVSSEADTTITLSASDSTIVCATLEASATIEISGFELSPGYDHIAAHVISTGAGICAAVLLREMQTDPVTQIVATGTAL